MRKFVTIISLIACCFSSFASSFIGISADGSKDEFQIGNVRSLKLSPQKTGAKGYRTIVFNQSSSSAGSVSSPVAIMTYPNPVTDHITISGIEESDEVRVIDMEGSTVLQGRGSRVEVNGLSAGNYILSVKNQSVKFIKK